MNETALTITGNLTSDPDLRFTPTGTAVANFTVAATPRRFDKSSGGWVDGEAIFMRCTVWRTTAENVAESLTRGARVVVTGRLRPNNYETRDGDKRTMLELDVDDIGASLKFATVKVDHAKRTNGDADRPADNDAPPF
jgi:single-strand DNA-binding protein